MPHSELHIRVRHLPYRRAGLPAPEKHLEANRRAVLIPPACKLYALRTVELVEFLHDVGKAVAQTVSAEPAHRHAPPEPTLIVGNRSLIFMFCGHSVTMNSTTSR